jgi:putative radical SAM enzyme (TIGR03279 family)
VIDIQFYGAEESFLLRVRRGGEERTVRIQRRYNEPLGVGFDGPLFDTGIRRCHNDCEFCFVTQMPPGLRRSLYVKDDDYRHSFLFGNYITLTNLTEEDWDRIGEQHLSPLYVSVHATEADLRGRMLHNSDAPDLMGQLRRLAGMGIGVHTQIVLVPGLNDGLYLDRSIGDLADLHPAVRSISVVPVGLTKFHRGGCRLHTLEEARGVFEQVTDWQERLRVGLGVSFVYLSDEWYLRLGAGVPPQDAYDGLDLTENGVGLTRRFLDDWLGWGILRGTQSSFQGSYTLVTGELFAPVLRQVSAGLANVEVLSIANHFFGETVTVAGLLTGQDVIEQLRGWSLGERVVLPAAMFGGPQGQSVDEVGPKDIGEALERDVIVAHTLGGLLAQVERDT